MKIDRGGSPIGDPQVSGGMSPGDGGALVWPMLVGTPAPSNTC